MQAGSIWPCKSRDSAVNLILLDWVQPRQVQSAVRSFEAMNSTYESQQASCWRAGEAELPGLTDEEKPRQRGPKRATKIRKLFSLGKEDDVRKYVSTYATTKEKDGKKHVRCPKIQRLITPARLQRKRAEIGVKRKRIEKVSFLSLPPQAHAASIVHHSTSVHLGLFLLPGCPTWKLSRM